MDRLNRWLCHWFGYCPPRYDPEDDELVSRWRRIEWRVAQEQQRGRTFPLADYIRRDGQ